VACIIFIIFIKDSNNFRSFYLFDVFSISLDVEGETVPLVPIRRNSDGGNSV